VPVFLGHRLSATGIRRNETFNGATALLVPTFIFYSNRTRSTYTLFKQKIIKNKSIHEKQLIKKKTAKASQLPRQKKQRHMRQ